MLTNYCENEKQSIWPTFFLNDQRNFLQLLVLREIQVTSILNLMNNSFAVKENKSIEHAYNFSWWTERVIIAYMSSCRWY